MWIRSQNKRVLAECKHLYIKEYLEGDFSILDSVSDLFLGTYKTKERAIEVLDNIQMNIQSLEEDRVYNLSSIVSGCNLRDLHFVYEMPQE